MAELEWDLTGQRIFEAGIGLGVLYMIDGIGEYTDAHPWDGLSAVTETASGADVSGLYADNKRYASLIGQEEFSGTIEAYTFPEKFLFVDGAIRPQPGVAIHQQRRKFFGLSYVTLIGNDVEGLEFGFKLHLVWGAVASPSERANATMSDSPEAMTMSWDFTTTPTKVSVFGLKPTSSITIDSTKVPELNLSMLQDILYGSASKGAGLPPPWYVVMLMAAMPEEDIDGGTPVGTSSGVIDGGGVLGTGGTSIDGGTPWTINLSTLPHWPPNPDATVSSTISTTILPTI